MIRVGRAARARWPGALAVASLVALLVALASPAPAEAQIAVSANDNKVVNVDGKVTVVKDAPPDTATIIDLGSFPPKVIAEIDVPASVVGPPLSVAITPDESLALVTAATKIDPQDPTKTTAGNQLTVIDLKAQPPKVIQRLEAGKGAAGLSVNRKGDLALVANRGDNTVSVFSIRGKTVAKIGTVNLGDKTGPSHAVFSPDGKTALVTLDVDNAVAILNIEGQRVEVDKRKLTPSVRPYGADISADGMLAVVANLGRTNGDVDTISVVDLAAKPFRVVDTIAVGQTPEGILFSPDGKLVAVVVMLGSNKAKESPFYNDGGALQLYKVEKTKLSKVAEAKIGHWSQGIAFSADGQHILVQNMIEKNIMVFRWKDGALTDTGHRIPVKGGPAGIRTATK
jgi:DNA-binding beta-propeller fold protein YncE